MNAIIVHTAIIDEDLTGETTVTNTVPTNWSLKAEKNCNYYYCLYSFSQRNMLCEQGLSTSNTMYI